MYVCLRVCACVYIIWTLQKLQNRAINGDHTKFNGLAKLTHRTISKPYVRMKERDCRAVFGWHVPYVLQVYKFSM